MPPATKSATATVTQLKRVTTPATSLTPAERRNSIAVTPAKIKHTPAVICAQKEFICLSYASKLALYSPASFAEASPRTSVSISQRNRSHKISNFSISGKALSVSQRDIVCRVTSSFSARVSCVIPYFLR